MKEKYLSKKDRLFTVLKNIAEITVGYGYEKSCCIAV